MDALLRTMVEVQARLDQAGIRSALIGGLAVGAWGKPRVTEDVDFKVAATREMVPQLLAAVGPEFPPSNDGIRLARSMGVLFLDGPEGIRVDLLPADLGFDWQALDRAVDAEVLDGQRARVVTAEDLILYKLITTRARDVEDAKFIVREQGQKLDRAYIEHWLRQFEQALEDSTLVETFRSLR